jgi:hypothetical protein
VTSRTSPIGVKYPRYRGPSVTAQNFGYGRFLPAANDWETIHPVRDKDPQVEAEEGATNLKGTNPRCNPHR